MNQHELAPTGLSAGRAALLAAGLGYAVLVIFQAFTLPDRVPGHVGTSGEVTWWGDRASHILMASIVGVLLFAMMWFLPRLIGKLPKETMNLPHKDYWLAHENLPRARRMMADDLGWIGAATLGFAGFAIQEVANVAEGRDASTGAFWWVFGAYLVVVLGWSLWTTFGPRWKPPSHPLG